MCRGALPSDAGQTRRQANPLFGFAGDSDDIAKRTVQALHIWNTLLPQRRLESRVFSMVPREQSRITVEFTPQERVTLNYFWFAFFPLVMELVHGNGDSTPEFPHERLPLKEHWETFMDTLTEVIVKVEEHLPESVLPRTQRLGFIRKEMEVASA